MLYPRRRLAVAAAILALLLAVPVLSADAPPKGAPSRRASRDGPTRLLFGPERLPDGRVILHARGPIAEGDAAELEAMARALKAAELWLDSPGGSAAEGMRIGRTVRSLGLTTRVDEQAVCASACVDAFLGGVRRFVAELGALDVHRPTATSGPEWRKRFDAAVRKEGLDAAVRTLEGAGMLLAYEHAAFLREMGVGPEIGDATYQTPNTELRRLTREELQGWRVVAGQWNPTADGTLTIKRRMRRIMEEALLRAQVEPPRAQQIQREAEEMLRSPDAERRRADEALLRQAASIRRRAGETPHRPPSTD